jgi:hypothetical protein
LCFVGNGTSENIGLQHTKIPSKSIDFYRVDMVYVDM